MQRFGEKLRQLRKHHQLTQMELGEQLAVNWRYVGALERGEKTPNAAMLIKLSNLFGVSLDQLMKDNLELEE